MRGKQLSKQFLREIINRSAETEADRRLFLRSAGLAGAGAVGLGLAGAGAASAATPDDQVTNDQRLSDYTVLNFALNLEYLEAEFYQYGAYGHGLNNSDTDGGSKATGDRVKKGGVDVKAGARVKFADRTIRQYAEEIAQDEINHVRFLRTALGDYAVPRPQINLTTAFDAAATAAGVDQGGKFDPFASDLAFLLGSFIFEDVGVTAYKGGAALINSDTYLDAAGSILAVEAYHAGIIRSTLYGIGGAAIDAANKIAAARNSLNPDVDNDQGIVVDGQANLVPTDANSIVFGRTTQQVHNIAYLNPAKGVLSGGFFPKGTNNTNPALTTT